MYATTRQFLDYFSLKTLDQLPALAEIRDLETLNAELGFSDPLPVTGQEQQPGATPEQASEQATEELPEQVQSEQSESSPGLTVVGGTAHVSPETNDTDEPVTLDEAVDDLEARASQAEATDIPEDDADADEDIDSELDDYPDSSPPKPESQI
jgi:segregation and condensation protein B